MGDGLLWPAHAMPSRAHHGDILQLRPDLWRVPPSFRSALLEQVEAVWEATAADSLVKLDRTDIEAAYRRAREALGER